MVQHLAASTVDMFEAYALPVTATGEERTSRADHAERSYVASIGFAGDKVRGSLVLITTKTAIESWLAAMGAPSSEEADVSDAVGEFSNMLLGRLKARLLGEGLAILLSTPTTTIGTELHVMRPAGGCAALTFDGPGWALEVRLTASFEEGFALVRPDPKDSAAEAGDMMFF
jgi:CheY-specific phosphatase CheX